MLFLSIFSHQNHPWEKENSLIQALNNLFIYYLGLNMILIPAYLLFRFKYDFSS